MISVIIPTRNRLNKLAKTLASLNRQILEKTEFEVIVIDDGGDNEAENFVLEYAKATGLNLKYYYINHQGPAGARNKGINQAGGSIIFFCGDDTYLDENLLAIHARRHRQEKNIAVLGLALWDEAEEVSNFMRWLAPAGPQFHYQTIKSADFAGYNHFYTCNISLEKKWLENEKFDLDFAYAAFEDIDLGWRLEKKGLKIIFDRQAVVYHSHHYEPIDFYLRMDRVGRSAVILLAKYKNDLAGNRILKFKYAPFLYFPGVKTFNWFSRWLAQSSLIKKISIKHHWFWNVCYHYSSGIINELNKKNEINRFKI